MEVIDEKYAGLDNHKKPKSDFLKKLADGDDKALAEACDLYIWLSAYANNNPRSDYHWMCNACYDECQRRGKPEIYSASHKRQSAR